MDIDKKLNAHLLSDVEPMTYHDVLLDYCTDSYVDVINKCGEMLGISEELTKSLFNRNKRNGSYVGDGFGIVHIEREFRHRVKNSRIVVIRLCDEIEWKDPSAEWRDGKMKCVIGVASNNNNHSNILAVVGRVLTDPDTRDFLKQTDDIDKIVELFS